MSRSPHREPDDGVVAPAGWLRWSEVTFDLFVHQRHVRREVGRELLFRSGSWSTWCFAYQARYRDRDEWAPIRIALVRVSYAGRRYMLSDVVPLPLDRAAAATSLDTVRNWLAKADAVEPDLTR